MTRQSLTASTSTAVGSVMFDGANYTNNGDPLPGIYTITYGETRNINYPTTGYESYIETRNGPVYKNDPFYSKYLQDLLQRLFNKWDPIRYFIVYKTVLKSSCYPSFFANFG